MNFTLRPWKDSDLDSLVKYASNKDIAKYLTNTFPYPYTAEDGKKFIEFTKSFDPIHSLAIIIEGKAIGGIGIHQKEDVYSKNAEIGYWLAEPFWGKGIMSKAIVEAIDYGFKTFDIDRIFGSVFEPNTGSQKVLEKCGFIFEAKFERTVYKNGEFLNELIYGLRRDNWNKKSSYK